MRRRIAIAALFTVACSDPEPSARGADTAAGLTSLPALGTPRLCAAEDVGYFARTPLTDLEGWYGQHLRAAGEARLCPSAAVEEYRFLWLRSFHRPVVVRVAADSAGRATLTARVLDGAGGYEPGRVARDTTFTLSPDRWRELRRRLDMGFWHVPTHPPPDGLIGLDGAQWILEGVAGGQYHVVDRRNPQGPFREACLGLLRASGFYPSSSDEVY